MDRLTNYLFIFVLIGVFVLDARAPDHQRIFLGAAFAALFCIVAFLFNWLSLDGARAGAVLGTLTYGLGGFPAAFLLLFFFLSSTLFSFRGQTQPDANDQSISGRVRRDGMQVWSNGFWFSLFLIPAFVFESELFQAGAISAVAAATADTWATELGSRRTNASTYLLTGFIPVKPGTDGGVSLPGTLAALAGSFFIAVFSVFLFSLPFSALLIILISGFSGSFADSYLGAAFQRTGMTFSLPVSGDGINTKVSNNMVNWLATGYSSLLAIILTLIF